jgi:hypothetical protein
MNNEENIQNNQKVQSPTNEQANPTVQDASDEPKTQPPTPPNSEQPTKKKGDNGLSEDEKLLVRTGSSINLVPKKSQQEVQKEKKKFSFSVSSIMSLILLVSLSLGVVLFNIVSKQQLRLAEEKQYEIEVNLQAYTDKFISNEEIIERIDLYKDVQEGVFSPREVVEYVMEIVERQPNIEITSFNMTDELDFEISGNTTELEPVAKVWYMLGTDENIVTVNLESVGKGEEGVRFSFKGELERDKFIKN